MDYKGIKIYDKVIIVERTSIEEGGYNWRGRTINQGYVVDINNKKMLETALSWARWTKRDKSLLNGKNCWDKDVTEEQRKAYKDSEETVEGVIHEYENGNFSITLDEAAGWSSQGGKLSFWNCIITSLEDNKAYLIGINSELLLHLMMSTTLVKGTCQEKVWLGRVKGTQVGVFTPDMEDFAQAKKDEETRTRKKTSSYQPGDILETISTKELYLGEVYSYANEFEKRIRSFNLYGYYNDYSHYIKIYKKPKKMHAYLNLRWSEKESSLIKDGTVYLKSTKAAKTVIGKNIQLKDKLINYIKDYPNEYNKLIAKRKDYSVDSDSPYPFDHFLPNIAVRLTDTYSPEEIKDDMLKVIEYQQKENPDRNKNDYNKTIVFEEGKIEDEKVYYYGNFDTFSMYSRYYKKNI